MSREMQAVSKVSCGAIITAMLAGGVLRRNMKADIALKNTT
jgi:hypothetical protein